MFYLACNSTAYFPFCSIGEVYRQQGKLIEALTMHEEVLRVRAAVFGLEHPDVAAIYMK